MRVLVFLGVVLLLFLPLNILTYRQLVRLHPRRRRWVRIAIVAGNLLWPLLPMLRTFNPLMRVLRAILGPPWFGWLCLAILYSIVIFLIFLAWIPFRARPFAAFAKWPSRVFLWTTIIGSIIGIYQCLVPLRVEHATLHVANLPPSMEGTRLALLGDLHVGLFTRPSRLTKIFTTVTAAKPDAILLAGDLVDDDPFYTPKLLAGTAPVPAATPIYAVYGNHEMYGNPYDFARDLRGSRVRLLLNEGVPLRELWIMGVSDPAAQDAKLKPDLAHALLGKPANALPIVFAHQPRVLDEARKHNVPIAFCAHTHGGQLGFRPLHWSLAGLFLPYHMGLYDVPPTRLFVTTGAGYWVLPFRLGMEPEVVIITLRR